MVEAPREYGAALVPILGRAWATLELQACLGQEVSRDCRKDRPFLHGASGEGMAVVPNHRAWMPTMGRGLANPLVHAC